MIAQDLSSIIQSQICDEIRVAVSGDRVAVSMPLTFGDGDACRLFVSQREDGTLTITDDGLVVAVASGQGIDLLSPGYATRFEQLAQFFGANAVNRELQIQSNRSDVGDAIFCLTQACLELSKLGDTPERKKRGQNFNANFAKLTEEAFGDEPFEKNWHHPEYDPKSIYQVDYQRVVEDVNWLVYGIGSVAKCWKASATIQHYKLKNLTLRSVVAYGKTVQKDQAMLEVLADNAEYKFSMDTERVKYAKFLRGLKPPGTESVSH